MALAGLNQRLKQWTPTDDGSGNVDPAFFPSKPSNRQYLVTGMASDLQFGSLETISNNMVVGFDSTPTLVSKNVLADSSGIDFSVPATWTGSQSNIAVGQQELGTSKIYAILKNSLQATAHFLMRGVADAATYGNIIGFDVIAVSGAETTGITYIQGIIDEPTTIGAIVFRASAQYSYAEDTGNATYGLTIGTKKLFGAGKSTTEEIVDWNTEEDGSTNGSKISVFYESNTTNGSTARFKLRDGSFNDKAVFELTYDGETTSAATLTSDTITSTGIAITVGLKTGTLASPPVGMIIGEDWWDTTGSSVHPIKRTSTVNT